MATRKQVDLKCGCTRRMPRSTAMQRLKDQAPVTCPTHGETVVVSVEGPEALQNLFRF